MATAKKAAPRKAASAAKKAQEPASKARGATRSGKPKAAPKAEDPELGAQLPEVDLGLTPTDTEGVFLNRKGVKVDANGTALSFKQMQSLDTQRWAQVIGSTVDSPAKLLKAVALDPVQPLPMRVDAAKSAAPYFDRKMPQALDGGLGEDGKAVPLFDTSKLSALSDAELTQMRALLAKAGAAL